MDKILAKAREQVKQMYTDEIEECLQKISINLDGTEDIVLTYTPQDQWPLYAHQGKVNGILTKSLLEHGTFFTADVAKELEKLPYDQETIPPYIKGKLYVLKEMARTLGMLDTYRTMQAWGHVLE